MESRPLAQGSGRLIRQVGDSSDATEAALPGLRLLLRLSLLIRILNKQLRSQILAPVMQLPAQRLHLFRKCLRSNRFLLV